MNSEWIGGLPFYSPSNEKRKEMNIGGLVEELIYLKRKYGIGYPNDNAINDACNILSRLPRNCDITEWLILNPKPEE